MILLNDDVLSFDEQMLGELPKGSSLVFVYSGSEKPMNRHNYCGWINELAQKVLGKSLSISQFQDYF